MSAKPSCFSQSHAGRTDLEPNGTSRSFVPLIALFFVAAAIQPARVSGQTSGAPTQTPQNDSNSAVVIRRGANEFGVLGGLSFHGPTLWGNTEDARFGNIAVRYGRVLAANKTVAFEWTIEATPLAVLSLKRFIFTQTSAGNFTVTTSRESVYGAGLSPIGLKFNFRPQRRVQPFASATGGFLLFEKDIPVPGAARFTSVSSSAAESKSSTARDVASVLATNTNTFPMVSTHQ